MDVDENKCSGSVYLYGMVAQSSLYRLVAEFPALDGYGEIQEFHCLPGGEAGNAATVLSKLGYSVKLDGPFLGRRTRDPIRSFFERIGVDCSGMEYDESFDGVEDMVIVAGKTRTVFAQYVHYYSGPRRWSEPNEAAISSARMVGLDPYFFRESERVAELCVRHGVPYVTIDCLADSFVCKNASVVVISSEYIGNKYSDYDLDALFELYLREASGLVVFTFGSRDIMYGRHGSKIRHMKPFNVEVKSTLGAGDTFRAGIMYGLLNGWGDDQVVRVAAALAACACCNFPIGYYPPSQGEIMALMTDSEE